MCGDFTIMGFLFRQRILHINVPPLDLFAWLKVAGVRFQRAIVKVMYQVRGRVFNPLYVSKSGDALKWLGIVLEFESRMSSFDC